MGLVKIIPQDSLPENPGVTELIDGGTCKLSVANPATVTFGTNTITYTATTGTLPTDQEIFDLWESVAGAANGASGPAAVAPIVLASNGDILYPAIT